MPASDAPPSIRSAEDEDLDIMLVVLRAALRWKQKDLARESEIGNSSISDYERRKKAPGRKNLGKLLDAMAYRPAVLDFMRRFLHELRQIACRLFQNKFPRCRQVAVEIDRADQRFECVGEGRVP